MRTVIVTAIGSFSADIVIKKCRENGIRVIGCDVYPREWIADAGNVEAFYQVPYATDTDHYIGTMMSLCRKEGAEAVIPLTDAEIDVFNLHRDEFSEINVTLCMSDKACIGLCRDKMELYRYLEEHMGGTVIPTLRLGDADPDEIRYPAVCKPYNGRSSQGLKMVGSRREMEGVLGETDPADYIVQPMIKGNVVTVDVVRSLSRHMRSYLPQGAFADSKRSRNLCAGIQKPPAGGTLPGHCRAVGNQGMREHGIYRGPGRRLPHAGVQSQIFRRRGVFLSGGI